MHGGVSGLTRATDRLRPLCVPRLRVVAVPR